MDGICVSVIDMEHHSLIINNHHEPNEPNLLLTCQIHSLHQKEHDSG